MIDCKSIQSSVSFTRVIHLNTHTGRLIFSNQWQKSPYPVSYAYTSKWTTAYLIKLNIDTYMQFFNSCFYHTQWICHIHTLSEVAVKVSGIGSRSCSIKHLIMMSDTVALLLSRSEWRMSLWYKYIHISETKLLNSIFTG